MATLRRRKVIDKNIERKIIIGLIVSTKICNEILQFCQPECFDISFCKIVLGWIKDYYEAYKEAPFKHITDIYNAEKAALGQEDQGSIEEFLGSLSEEFAGEGVNEEYILNNSRIYLKKQSIIKYAMLAQTLAQGGDVAGAEKALLKFGNMPTDTAISWVNPFGDEEFLLDAFHQVDASLFELDGKYGTLLGPFRREWLLGIMGPMKRGKTWMLQHFAITAMFNRRRVLFISLEMPAKDLALRFYRQLVGLPDEADMTYMPVFDCVYNQKNTCERPERKCHESAPMEGPREGQTYRPCNECREGGGGDYDAAVWGIFEKLPAMDSYAVRKKLKGLRPQIGINRLRLISYPAFSANITNILNDIELLEIREGFVPDVIVIDYADILAPENSKETGRDKIDSTWKALKRMGALRKALVVTGSQTNRDSIEKAIIDEKHTAEDIRKLAHVDLMITLNQTNEEKKVGAMRISVLEHRWKQFDKTTQALLLQNYATGQAAIESEITVFHPENFDKKKKSKEE